MMSKKSGEKQVREGRVKIMVFGTFDGLHKGHLNFFKQAKNFIKNSFLIVSIARDENVFKIKGKYPDKTENERLALVRGCKLVDRVILAGKNKYLSHVLKEGPDIIALGYDQKAYVKELKRDLKKLSVSDEGAFRIEVIRLKPYKETIYKNHLLKKKREI